MAQLFNLSHFVYDGRRRVEAVAAEEIKQIICENKILLSTKPSNFAPTKSTQYDIAKSSLEKRTYH